MGGTREEGSGGERGGEKTAGWWAQRHGRFHPNQQHSCITCPHNESNAKKGKGLDAKSIHVMQTPTESTVKRASNISVISHDFPMSGNDDCRDFEPSWQKGKSRN